MMAIQPADARTTAAQRRRYLARMGIVVWRERRHPEPSDAQTAGELTEPVSAASAATTAMRADVPLLAVHGEAEASSPASRRLRDAMLRAVGADPRQRLADGDALLRELQRVKPRVVLLFGGSVAAALLGGPATVDHWREQTCMLPDTDCPVVVTFTSDWLLHNPGDKPAAWQDLKRVLRLLRADSATPAVEDASP